MQPRPSIAFALQGRIAAALGPAMDAAMQLAFVADDEGSLARMADTEALGEGLALQTFRNARSGRMLVTDGGQRLDEAGLRLWAVLMFVSQRSGVRLDAALLLGEHERVAGKEGTTTRWTRTSLLHRLLMDSSLAFGGEGPAPKSGSWLAPTEPDSPGKRLAQASAGADVGAFVNALDDVLVSADELALLSAWAVYTLWRPF